jgi:LCP family protein required for cell wall assembly
VLSGALVVLLVLLVAGLGTLAYYDRRIDRVEVAALGQGADPDGGDTNYLLVGGDSRQGLTEEELREVRAAMKGGGNEGTLTDTIIVLHVPDGGGTPSLVSIPRDSWVEVPGAGRGRVNTAYAIGERNAPGGGPSTLVETVQALSGLQIDHYLEVGFIAFLRLTEALGGVDVNLCAPARDPEAGIDLPAGPQRLSGGDALGFVRQRKGLPRGDLDRVARQQYFLGQAAKQVLSPGTLLRPDKQLRLLGAVTDSVKADEDLSTFDLARLAWRLRGAAGGSLAFTTVPVADPAAVRGGASVVLLDEPALPAFFASLSPEGDTGEPPPTVAIAPSAIRLEVRNGTSRSGLARTAAEELSAQGFTVTRTANADRQDATESVVLHGADRADSAATVAASVPGAVTRQDDALGANGLVLVVGEDYRGVREVTVDERSAAPEEPAADPGAGAPAPAPEDDAGPCIT